MKKRILIVLGILILAGGIGTGAWYYFYGKDAGSSSDSVVYVSSVSVITERNQKLPIVSRVLWNRRKR